MCIPHGTNSSKSGGYLKKSKPKKHITPISKAQFEKGDPNFIDERIKEDEIKETKSLFESLFS